MCSVEGLHEEEIREREVVEQVKPYTGSQVDDNTGARAPGPWEVDMRNEFPLLFISRKEAILKLPHSESVAKCPGASSFLTQRNRDLQAPLPLHLQPNSDV